MTAPAPSVRWQLLTASLDLRARWRAICNELAPHVARVAPLAVPPLAPPPYRAAGGTPSR